MYDEHIVGNKKMIIKKLFKTGLVTLLAAASYLGAEAKTDFNLNGDLRVREQILENRFNNVNGIEATSSRLRLAPTLKFGDYELGVRGVAEASSLANTDIRLQDKKEFSLDRVYLKIKPQKRLELAIGELDNPFTQVIPAFDKDIPVTGAVVQYEPIQGLKLAGVYDLGRVLTQDSKQSMAGVLLTAEKKGEGVSLGANLGFQHSMGREKTDYVFSNSKGAAFDNLVFGVNVNFPKLTVPVRVFAEGTHNFDAASERNSRMFGIKLGDASKVGNADLILFYNHLERDSMQAGLVNRDTPRTNIDTRGLRAEYKFSGTFSAYLVLGNPKHLVPTGATDTERMKYLELGGILKF